MDLVCNPSSSRLLALNIHDSVKFLHLSLESTSKGALTKSDFTLTDISSPSFPQQVDSHNVSCMTWCSYGDSSAPNALAVGLASGKVLLLWPGIDTTHFNNGLLHQTSTSKRCTALAWNKAQPQLLAMGMERSRTEHSLIIMDLSTANPSAERMLTSPSDLLKINAKSLSEACFAETVNSMMWTGTDSNAILVGVGSKFLRIYDVRNIRSPSNVVSTKATFGVCQDPCLDRRFASFYENQVHIWDLRNFSKPAAYISAKHNILKAEWCPTRGGLLATISSGSSDGRVIRVYDTAHTMVTDGDPDVAYRHVEQIVKLDLGMDEAIGTFAWRQDSKNCLIAVTNNGTLHCVDAPERISIGWTKDLRLIPACKQIYQCLDMQIKQTIGTLIASPLEGIEGIIYKRATNGYGLIDRIDHGSPEINLQPSNRALPLFWNWIKMAKESFPVPSSQESKPMQPKVPKGMWSRGVSTNSVLSSRFGGLCSELKQTSSTAESVAWIGVVNTYCTIYKSLQRDRALKMCGWVPIRQLRVDNLAFRSAQLKSTYVERAATTALWHLDMQLAIDILRSTGAGDDTMHSVIAMALSGYPGNGSSAPLWHEMCNNLQKSMPSKYLRAAFAFLNAQIEGKSNYRGLLQSTDISISDRVGFACTYLPDDVLTEVLDELAESAAKSGDLAGVIVTGLTNERGVELLQNYVDATKDIQTAALALMQTGSNEILRNRDSLHLLEGYKDLLNVWRLWNERAVVDSAIGKMILAQQTKPQPQGISVQCNFCGKSVQHNAKMQNFRGRGVLHGSGMLNKPTSCPSCRKPLPRCSVCCLHLGTSQTNTLEDDDRNIDCWFLWCPHCQHGGHSDHLTSWFQEHTDCPVPGCTCKCWDFKT